MGAEGLVGRVGPEIAPLVRVLLQVYQLPVFLAGVMRVTGWMGSGSAGYIFGVDVFLSIASLTTVWFGYLWAKRVSGFYV